MCGRFFIAESDIDDFAGLVNDIERELLKPREGEIFPGDYAPILTPAKSTDSPFDVHIVKWGFPLAGSKKPIFNARCETLQDKPLFRIPFSSRRCLVPSRGFYEWQDAGEGKKRIRHRIRFADGEMMYMGGLYWFFDGPDNTRIPAFTIITTPANLEVGRIHDRMPVIVPASAQSLWLGADRIPDIQHMLLPFPEGKLLLETG